MQIKTNYCTTTSTTTTCTPYLCLHRRNLCYLFLFAIKPYKLSKNILKKHLYKVTSVKLKIKTNNRKKFLCDVKSKMKSNNKGPFPVRAWKVYSSFVLLILFALLGARFNFKRGKKERMLFSTLVVETGLKIKKLFLSTFCNVKTCFLQRDIKREKKTCKISN